MIEKLEFFAKVQTLDFSWIELKLTKSDPNIAKIWSLDGVKDAIMQYKNFMYLLYKYHETGHKIVPSIEVDEIWHHHILDTRKYLSDCEKAYGFFMHHFPYFGMRGSEDFLDLQRSFQDTQRLYFEEFNEYMYEVDF